jgi:DNA gyrase subunit B
MEKGFSEDDIKTVTSCEHVRLRPGLYFAKCFNENNLDSLPLELACHAIDECYDNNCTTIEIQLFESHFSIKYDAGMSLEKNDGEYKAELIMTAIFACRNEKKHLAVGEEFCELGIATINFASEFCRLTTVSNGLKGIFHFECGQISSRDVQPTIEQSEFTEIVLKPDPEIFDGLKFSYEGVKSKAEKLGMRLEGIDIVLNHEKIR